MNEKLILIADDDQSIRTVMVHALEGQGYRVRATGTAATLWQWVQDGDGDIVITDVVMPDGNGLELIPQIKKIRPNLHVIAMSAQSTLHTAVKASERGAFDYLPKPFDLSDLAAIVRRALHQGQSSQPVVASPPESDEVTLIGRSLVMQEVYRTIARMTATDLSVLIVGESGTGKELVARSLHEFSKRKNQPFVAINMAAIPKDLIESELFGHEKGAFTGATQRYSGRFEQAEGGTLFLDEIGDMPTEAQTRLLRVLQEGEYTTVGGRQPIKAHVRIVAATHRDLRQLVDQGRFREDLYYRLNVVPIRIPPLRERREDIADLVQYFSRHCTKVGLPHKNYSVRALECLEQYRWPGNVRELENMVKRLAALNPDDLIDQAAILAEISDTQPNLLLSEASESSKNGAPKASPDQQKSLAGAVDYHLQRYFAAHGRDLPANGLYERILREVEIPLISRTLEATNGNQLRAATLLGLNRNTLRKKIRDLDLDIPKGA